MNTSTPPVNAPVHISTPPVSAPGFVARVRASRGFRTFVRNRLANVAMVIIAVFALVGGWVWAMEGIDWVGLKTGQWRLTGVPVVGALLPEKTLERAGPRWVPGFGNAAEARRREDHADYLLKRASVAIDAAADAKDSEKRSQALSSARLAERGLADEPIEKLQAWRDEAKQLFREYDKHKHMLSLRGELSRSAAVALEPGVSPEEAEDRRLDVVLALADLKAAVPEDPVSTFELGDASVEKIRGLQEKLHASLAAEDAGAEVSDPAEKPSSLERLKKVEEAVGRLMPWPTGMAGTAYALRLGLGTDAQGRSILIRGVYAIKVAIQVGVIVALFSVFIGAIIGAAAGYFGGWIDHAATWLYSTLSSLPQLVLLALIAFLFLGGPYEQTLLPVYVALCLTSWIGPCRVIRGEVLKIKELEYAQAATVIGFSQWYILFRHVLPNTTHLMFINFSLLFISAIKSEVILTYLGLGVKDGSSWGLMISQAAPEVISGFFWQIGTATVFMLVLVLAFNVVSDALQDAFDPRHVG